MNGPASGVIRSCVSGMVRCGSGSIVPCWNKLWFTLPKLASSFVCVNEFDNSALAIFADVICSVNVFLPVLPSDWLYDFDSVYSGGLCV